MTGAKVFAVFEAAMEDHPQLSHSAVCPIKIKRDKIVS